MSKTKGVSNQSDKQVEDYYMRWREVMLVVAKRNGILVCAKQHEAYFRDACERLKEDPWWLLQSANIEATMMAHPECPDDELLVWTAKGKGVTRMSTFLGSKKGFGQFNKIMAPSADGVVDFGDAFDKLKG
jgi:hypothetical protein